MTYDTQNKLEDFRHEEADYFDRSGKAYNDVYLKRIAEDMFKLINALEVEVVKLELEKKFG